MEHSAVNLKRTDVTSVQSTSRSCIRLLPQGKKSTKQKLVVGDMSGVVSCFSVGKSLDIKNDFRNNFPKAISRVSLHEDQVMVASGATVRALNKKGKEFFTLETNMSEDIRFLCIRSPFLYIGGQYTATAFEESTEKGFYMSPDKINDMDLDPMESEGPSAAAVFLACQDRTIRRVHHGAVTADCSCEAPVTALKFNPKLNELVYGTAGGTVSCIQKLSNTKLQNKWSFIPPTKQSAVSAITTTPSFSKSPGSPDVVVAREDGSVQVMTVNNASLSGEEEPLLQCIFTASMGEFVSAVDVGFFTKGDHEDIVVSTFSGKVVALSAPLESEFTVSTTSDSQPQQKGNNNNSNNNNVSDETGLVQQAAQQKVDTLTQEVGGLTQHLNMLKQQLQRTQQQLADTKKASGSESASAAVPAGAVSAICKGDGPMVKFGLVDRFFLDDSTGDLVLTTELDIPLGTVCISSEVPLNLKQQQQNNNNNQQNQQNESSSSSSSSSTGALSSSEACSQYDPSRVLPALVNLENSTSLLQQSHNNNSSSSNSNHNNNSSSSSSSSTKLASTSNFEKTKFLGVFRTSTADSSGMAKKLEIRFKVDEGKHGSLISVIHPLGKSHGATSRSYHLPPLSKHTRLAPADVPSRDSVVGNSQFAKMEILGAFSLKEMHHWLSSCLMELPEKIGGSSAVAAAAAAAAAAGGGGGSGDQQQQQQQEMITYHFRNMYIGTLLQITIAKGELVAYSQNAMTLTILRDHITRQATQRKVAVRIATDIKPEAVDVVIWLGIEMWRGLSYSAQQYELLDALKELEVQEGDLDNFLDPQLKDILGRSRQLQAEAQHHESNLKQLKGFLVEWLCDACNFSGSSASSNLDQVRKTFSHMLEMQVTTTSESELRIFCRDTCFPPGSSSSAPTTAAAAAGSSFSTGDGQQQQQQQQQQLQLEEQQTADFRAF